MKQRLLLCVVVLCSGPLWAQVQNVPYTVTYACSGGYGPYSFTFPISDPTSMTVTLNGTSVPATGYTIIPLNNNYINGGMVTLGVSYPCTTGNLVLTRSTQITQLTVFYDNMPALPGITGNAVNKLTEIAQELEGMFSTGGAVTSIQMQNAGVNYLTPAGGAITFNFQGCIVSGALGTYTISCTGGGSGANYTLSNLVAPTAVNVPLLPGTAGLALGSGALPWSPNIGSAAGETFSFDTSAQTQNRSVLTQDAPMTLPTTAQEVQLPSTALTGIMRGGAPMTAAEISGFGTTSGSNVLSPGSVANGKTLTIASGGSLICASGSTCPGSGIVNSGTATHLAYYASTGTGVSDMGADFTFSTHTLTGGASAIFDLHSASSFKPPGGGGTLTLGTTNQNWATLGTGVVLNTTTSGAQSVIAASGTKCYPYQGSSGTGCDTPAGTGVTGTGTNTYFAYWSGTSSLGSTADMTYTSGSHTFQVGASGIFTFASGGVVNANELGGTSIGTPTGTTNVVFSNSPTLVTPALGAATATSLLATGIIDGTAPITLTTGSSASIGGTYKSGYTYNQEATAATAITYTLPTAAAGLQYCIANSQSSGTPDTGTLKLATSASGQYIEQAGTLSASGGYIISGGAAGDAACVVGESSTVWMFYTQGGTWTLH